MRTSKPYEENRDLELLAQGSEHAFTRLFDHYRRRIFSVALRFLKFRELAEEVVQEVFLKVWMRREQLVKMHNFEGYLFVMTRNQIFDGIKDLAKESTTKKELAIRIQRLDGADHALLEKQYDELLYDVVSQLSPQQQQIFRLAKMQGLSHQAIAEQLHISKLTVKTHMAKALQRIRQNLQHHLTTFALLPVLLQILDQDC